MATVVLYEDRPTHWVGLKLALLSLREQDPALAVVAHAPTADDALRSWCERHGFAAALDTSALTGPGGWDVKPELLLRHLVDDDEVVWLDSDVLVARPLSALLARQPAGSLVVTEDDRHGRGQHGGPERTLAWGLEVHRTFPRGVNTALVRVHRKHTPVLELWAALLESAEYRAGQARPLVDRLLHTWGDQEVLAAVLGSSRAADVDVHLLAAGIEIAQCFGPTGFGVAERLRAAAGGGPWLVHAVSRSKPWRVERGWSMNRRTAITERRLVMEARTSPYTTLARRYRSQLEDDGAWLDKLGTPRPSGNVARTCPLPGLLLAGAMAPLELRAVALRTSSVRSLQRALDEGTVPIPADEPQTTKTP